MRVRVPPCPPLITIDEKTMNKERIIIDGSEGEGGGQILRSTLSLSMCTGTPVRIINIRAGRRKSGLMRQHLACVRASQTICGAQVTGDELGSGAVDFTPGEIKPGNYSFAIGSAGSTSLVFQTILPALMLATSTSTVTLSGGTHNGLAPSFDFIKHCFIPAVAKLGVAVDAQLHDYGFAPMGGGSWTATIQPADLSTRLKLTTPDERYRRQAIVTQSGVERSVAERELKYVRRKLGWAKDDMEIKQVESVGPGNLVSLRLSGDQVTEVIEEVGSRGIKAERVAGRAASAMKRFINSGAAVGEHLCDQLLLPLALGVGGRFTTVKPSLHTKTNILVIKAFVSCAITVKEQDEDRFEVSVQPA